VDLKELLQKANYEPVKVTLESDQMRVFSKDHLDKIRDSCSLIEIYKSSDKDEAGTGRIDVLVLLGDAACVTKAKGEIQEVITKEGAVETVTLSDAACKELLNNKGAKIQEIQSKFSTYVQVVRKGSVAKVFGSVDAVEKTKAAIEAFAKKVDSTASKTMTLEADQIGRVIGSKGATLNAIRKDCNVQITIDNNSPVLAMRGEQKDLDKAEQMINDVLSGEPKAKPEPKPRAAKIGDKAPAEAEVAAAPVKAKAKAKPKGYAGDATQDFPTLGGAEPKKTKPAAKAWGKNAEETAPAKEETPEQAYPELAAKKEPAAAPAPAKVEPVVQAPEEEDAGDCDDPFAMMGGMGEEQVYQVNMMVESELKEASEPIN